MSHVCVASAHSKIRTRRIQRFTSRGQEAKNVIAAGVCEANGSEGEVPLLVRAEEELET